MSRLIQHVRYALRQLRKSPGFTAVAIASLALGIGANTAIFTLINELLLKSLPVRDPQSLVAFGQQYGGGAIDGIGPGPLDLFPYEFYKQIDNEHEAFDGIAAYTSFTSRLSVQQAGIASSPATQAVGHLVSGNFFSVLGADPALGRTIVPSDAATPGAGQVAVISYEYWQREFAGDRGVLGKGLIVNGTPFTVIGVAAPKFYGVKLEQDSPDMWLPLSMQKQVMLSGSLLDPRGLYFLHLMGRRKPGMSLSQMQEWLNLQLRHYMSAREGANLSAARSQEIQKIYVELMPGGRGISDLRVDYADPLRILMGLVVIVLLIACANLANFLLAKATSREREISTRLALGASRTQIVLHMLAESLVLSFLGGAAGLLLASWGTRFLINFVVAGGTSTSFDASPNLNVLAFTFGLSLLTAFLFGLAPALRVSRVSITPGVGASTRSAASGATRTTRVLPKVLVALQMSLGLGLVLTAGLLSRTLRNLEHQDFGFERQNLLCVNIEPNIGGFKQEQLGGLYQRILDRMQSLPGVRAAALAGAPPISDGSWGVIIHPRGHTSKPNEDMGTSVNRVSARYFETVGIPLLSGRPIGAEDVSSSKHVVVVNRTLANHLFPLGNAVGQSVTLSEPDLQGEWEIVGIVKDAKYGDPRETPQRMAYLSTLQMTGDNAYAYWLQLQTEGDPENLAAEVRRALIEIAPNLPIVRVETIRQRLDLFTGKETLISQLSIFFSLLALLLACIGLYGVMTYNVMRRTNEIGVRMALGAQSNGVLWLVLKESLTLLGIGIVLGVPAALAATRLLQSQLFGIGSSDPLTVLAAVLIVAGTTVIAGYFPARRATKIDPMVALRYE
jgi:predicted permease